ncbi:hypothetical protein BKA69DRAFT_1100004 [Paraphysoderma sedebokerense]|nr:hypothetical protein BKA69DRAFT_1100004 [Paraphysoderma sedebokerense]
MLLSRFKPFICEQCANHAKALLFQSRSKVSANPSVRLISRSPANDNLGIGSSRYYGTRIKPKLKQRSPSYRHANAFEVLPEEKISREPLRPHQSQSSPFKSRHPSSQSSVTATQPLPSPRQVSLPLNKLTEYYIDTREINSIDSDQVKQFTEQVFASIEERKIVTPDSGKETNATSGEIVKSDYEKETLLQELNAVMYQNALLGRADVSKKALDLIQELNLPVSSYSFNNLILAHVRSSDLASAEKTFHFMHSKESPVKPNEYTYGIIMAEMVKQDRLDDAVTLFERLQEVGLKPTQPIFTSLATGFIAHGHVDKAYKLLEEMTFRYCLPDEVSYSTLIDACAKTGETERALFWLDALTAKNLHPTDVTFNALINACASRKDYYLTAFSILEQMQDVGFRPDAYTNSALMNACSRVGDVKRAGIIWNSIVQDIKDGETSSFTKYLVANLFLVFASRVPHLNTSGAPSPSKTSSEKPSNEINRSVIVKCP